MDFYFCTVESTYSEIISVKTYGVQWASLRKKLRLSWTVIHENYGVLWTIFYENYRAYWSIFYDN